MCILYIYFIKFKTYFSFLLFIEVTSDTNEYKEQVQFYYVLCLYCFSLVWGFIFLQALLYFGVHLLFFGVGNMQHRIGTQRSWDLTSFICMILSYFLVECHYGTAAFLISDDGAEQLCPERSSQFRLVTFPFHCVLWI